MFEKDDMREFLDMFSHEFRTPVAIINNHINNIERRYSEGNMEDMDLHQTAEVIRLCCHNLTRLSTNMSLFMSGKFKGLPDRYRYDVAQQLKSICFMTNEYFRKNNVEVTLSAKTKPLYFSLDPDVLQHIVVNLITNAIKYNNSEKKTIEIDVKVTQGNLVLQVKDNGAGIPKKDIDKIFDMYYRSSSNSGLASGLGMGLHIVACGVKSHGGDIKVTSTKNGTTFKITIPDTKDLTLGSPRTPVVSKDALKVAYADLLLLDK